MPVILSCLESENVKFKTSNLYRIVVGHSLRIAIRLFRRGFVIALLCDNATIFPLAVLMNVCGLCFKGASGVTTGVT